jgi:L-iditol 2-dehydrogenase
MKALVLHSAKNLTYEPGWNEVSLPPGWAKVRVHASGICGSDLPRIMQTGAYHHPMIPGHEFSGDIVLPGESGIPAGEKVAVLPIIPCGECAGCEIGPFHCTHYDFIGSRRDGGFAEFCAVPKENLLRLPAHTAYEEGAFIEPISVTLHVLRQSGMQPGARVFVFGAGAIGILTAQWARILGAREVVIADLRDESLQIAAECQVGKVINPKSEEFKSLGSFDYIFEAAGSTAALLSAIELATPRGTLTVVGRETKDTVILLSSFERLMRKELTLKGCWGYDLRQDADLVYRVFASGQLILTPMITHRLALPEGPELIHSMWNKEFFYCKAMFIL